MWCHHGVVSEIVHHEVVVRWDTVTDDPDADVMPDSTLSETWRKIVQQHLRLGPEAPTLQVTAKSWLG
jgi:hypothetical protein